MPLTVNVLGDNHEITSVHVKVQDEWRPSEIGWAKVQEEWREAYSFETMTEASIVGFRLYYRKHFATLQIPYSAKLVTSFLPTGSTPVIMDTQPKGVVFRYERQDPSNEGYQLWEGRLYALTKSGMLLDVAKTHMGESIQNKRIHYDDIGDTWETNQMKDMEVIVSGSQTYDDVGYKTYGWNRFFQPNDVIPPREYPNKDRMQATTPFQVSLIGNQNPFAWIGVQYDTHSFDLPLDENNMVGTSGYLDQTISSITVDGVPKPFSVEIL